MAYICFQATLSNPGQNTIMYYGDGSCLYLAATGTTASVATTNLNNAKTNKWVIGLKNQANTFWIYCPNTSAYVAIRAMRPDAYTAVQTGLAKTGQTVASTASFSLSGTWLPRYVTASFLADLWADKLMTTSSWLADIDSFSSYEDMALCPALSLGTYNMLYGTGLTQWSTSSLGDRYAASRYLGFQNSAWESGFQPYRTTPPAGNTGYTVTVNASTITMTISDEVQGYGTHAIRLISVYAVTTGGTETLILSKAGATTLSFGITTVSLGRQTTTVNGVKRFKMTFWVNAFNGVGATEFAVAGKGSEVYEYTDDMDDVVMYTEDLSSNITINSPGVDLVISTGY